MKNSVLFFLVFLFALHKTAVAQPPAEPTRTIEILSGMNMRMIETDPANPLITLSGNAKVKDGQTIISGDSIVVNQTKQLAEIFGHVHINDADTVNTYADYLKYVGGQRVAYLKRNVKLSDGKGTLYANDVEYNIASGVASYKNGGRVVNGKTILTSENAVYLSATKDVFFKKKVNLNDPKYNIIADSLKYNTQTSIADFIGPTRIKTKDGGTVNTRSGYYNLNTGEAVFFNRTTVSDSTTDITGDKIAYDDKRGLMIVEGNGVVNEKKNNVTVTGNYIEADKKRNTFLATRKPVLILFKDNDTTYIAADTLFSGLNVYNSEKKQNELLSDTLNKTLKVDMDKKQDSIRYFIAFHHVRIFNDSLQAISDSLHYSSYDSTFKLFKNPVVWNGKSQVTGDTMYLFTKNQKAKHLYVFNNSMVVNKENEGMFNQIGGRTLNAYFIDGSIDFVRIKGSPAESIYYPIDEDSAYVGMNRSSGDVIDITFVKKDLNKVKFVNNVDGVMYPINQIPTEKKYLRNYKWLDAKRPKNKLELFE